LQNQKFSLSTQLASVQIFILDVGVEEFHWITGISDVLEICSRVCAREAGTSTIPNNGKFGPASGISVLDQHKVDLHSGRQCAQGFPEGHHKNGMS